MVSDLTIAVTTVNRPEALRKCLSSIFNNVSIKYELLVYDNSPTEINKPILDKIQDKPNVRVIHDPELKCLNECRNNIVDNVETQYLLFVSDDITIPKKQVERMYQFITENTDIDIVSPMWCVQNRLKECGQYIHFGKYNGKRYVWKSFIHYLDVVKMGLNAIKVDIGLGTIMHNVSIYRKVRWDERYNWFYDEFDFGMQCYFERIQWYSLTNVVFYHHRIPYLDNTLKHLKSGKSDKRKFEEKWNVIHIGSLGAGLRDPCPSV